jgi:hypothetical protein
MLPDAVESIAEDNGRTDAGIVEQPDAEMVARAKEAPPRRIPNREREVTQQMFHATFAPVVVGLENQFGIRSG